MSLKKKKLIEACKSGNLEEVKALVKQGMDIHIDNDYALRWAVSYGYLEIVKYLVENDANIHADNNLSLVLASRNGHLEIVKYLIKNGADIHADNESSLSWAAKNGHLEVIKYLVEKGADIHASNNFALRSASLNNHKDIIYYLFSLYENKEQAFKIILELSFFVKNNISVVKNIIDNHELKLGKEFLEEIKENYPSIYDYLKLSKEIGLTQNSMDFNIG